VKFFLHCEGGRFAKQKCASKQKYATTHLDSQTDAPKVTTAKKCPFHRHLFDVMSFERKTASNKRYFGVRRRAQALFASTEGDERGTYTQY
jgi:hypothetical protein